MTLASRFKTFLLLSGLLYLVTAEGVMGVPNRPESDFQWFDGLRLIDLTAPFGFVRTPSRTANETTYGSRPALLIQRPVEGKWIAQSLALSFTKQTAKEDPFFKGYPVKFEESSLREYAALCLSEKDLHRDEPQFIRATSDHLELFILAAACWKQGAVAEAEALYATAVETAKQRKSPEGLSFHDQIAGELALNRYWFAICEAGEAAVPRAELREHFEKVASEFPGTKYGPLAAEWCVTLQRMEREERGHPKIADDDLERLPVERQVSEWIYRLRDQNGRQFMQPGRCDVFGELFPSGKGTTPAHQLARLGFAAVPQLIEALDDSTPSRSLGYRRFFYFSHTILTVGDCAETILSRIAGEEFYSSLGQTSQYMSTSGTIAETKQRVVAWWKDCGRDELAWLKLAILRGDPTSVRKARRLLERFSEEAPETIMQAISATMDGTVRANLLRALVISKADGIGGFLLRESEGPGPLKARVAAAEILRTRGDLRGEAAMLALWREIVAKGQFKTLDGRWVLAAFLGGSASSETIRLLQEAMPQLGAKERRDLLACIARSSPTDRLSEKLDDQSAITREAILIEALADKARVYGPNENDLFDPRMCDYAARHLAERFPNRYPFHWNASLGERDEMIFHMQNKWRAAHALEPLPQPVDERAALPANAVNRITRVTFGENGEALPWKFRQKVNALRSQTLTLETLNDLLAAHGSLDPAQTPRVGFEFIRSSDSRGVSLCVEAIPGTRRPEHECWNMAVLTYPPSAPPVYEGAFPRPYDAATEYQLTRLKEPVSAALAGELPFEIRGHLYLLQGDEESTP